MDCIVGAHAHRMLVNACNPMVIPDFHVFRPGAFHELYSQIYPRCTYHASTATGRIYIYIGIVCMDGPRGLALAPIAVIGAHRGPWAVPTLLSLAGLATEVALLPFGVSIFGRCWCHCCATVVPLAKTNTFTSR